jgi:hypothetical protein
MLNLLRSALLATVLATGLAAYQVIIWDGISSIPEIFIIPGDTITWTLNISQSSGPFVFALGETASPGGTSHTETFNYPGEYYYGLATSANSTGGKVTVNSAVLFNESITEYHLQLNTVVRWQWAGYQPPLPPPDNRGYFQMRDGAFDRNWMIPGDYEWFSGIENYTFHVQDPDPSPSHVNVVWESNGETYRSDPIPAGWVIRFYSTENRQLNVHVYQQTPSGEQSVWISPDLHKIGDSVVYGFGPGMYIALCDYDDSFSYGFKVESMGPSGGGSGSGSGLKKLVPLSKDVIYAAEISLFMIGVLGLGHFLMDQFDSKDKKDRKDTSPPPLPPPTEGGGGGDITSYALARAKKE